MQASPFYDFSRPAFTEPRTVAQRARKALLCAISHKSCKAVSNQEGETRLGRVPPHPTFVDHKFSVSGVDFPPVRES